MNKKITFIFALITASLFVVAVTASAQWKDNMGGSWNNPTSASIGNIVNDSLWNRVFAKARARDKARAAATKTGKVVETPVTEPQVSKKTPAQIDAAVRFRSTGTQLETQSIANELGGGDAELTKQMATIISTLLTEYEKAATAQGKPNDLALATTTALVYNSSIYNGTPEPDDARIMEIRDAMAELMVEGGTFAAMSDRQKQVLYEKLVISTMLAKAGYEEAQKGGDKSTMASYRELAGQTLTAVSGLPPEKIRFMPDAETIEALRKAAAPPSETNTPAPPTGPQNITKTTLSDSDFLNFDPFPDKPHIQPQKPLIGRLRKTITMADLAGKWTIGGGPTIQEYVTSSTQSETSVSLTREWLVIHADGRYEANSQSRASNTTIRESERGTIILSGSWVVRRDSNGRETRNQFVAFMDLPKSSAVLSLLHNYEGPPMDTNGLIGNCHHANGYITCMGGEEWVRIP